MLSNPDLFTKHRNQKTTASTSILLRFRLEIICRKTFDHRQYKPKQSLCAIKAAAIMMTTGCNKNRKPLVSHNRPSTSDHYSISLMAFYRRELPNFLKCKIFSKTGSLSAGSLSFSAIR